MSHALVPKELGPPSRHPSPVPVLPAMALRGALSVCQLASRLPLRIGLLAAAQLPAWLTVEAVLCKHQQRVVPRRQLPH